MGRRVKCQFRNRVMSGRPGIGYRLRRSQRLFAPEHRYLLHPRTRSPLPMPDIPEAIRDHLALALVPGLGPKLTAALLARFGSASAALQATAVSCCEIPHIGDKLATSLAAALRKVDIEPELRLLEKHDVRPVPLGFPGYPPPLASVVAPPPLLYFRGEWMRADANAIGIVGSRSCTSYGLRIAAKIGRELARAGFTIVSGLARGIDAAAPSRSTGRGRPNYRGYSRAACREFTRPSMPPLADEITAGRGCLITETPMAMEPQPGMFPARNRIISGLSRAVIVVEANAKSGRSSRPATRPSRAARFMPSPVRSIASPVLAVHELLRNGARLIRGADDVMEDLRGLSLPSKETGDRRQKTRANLSAQSVSSAPIVPEPSPIPPQLDPSQHARLRSTLLPPPC